MTMVRRGRCLEAEDLGGRVQLGPEGRVQLGPVGRIWGRIWGRVQLGPGRELLRAESSKRQASQMLKLCWIEASFQGAFMPSLED